MYTIEYALLDGRRRIIATRRLRLHILFMYAHGLRVVSVRI